MREVAAEAGVSLRLVQYYFGTKEGSCSPPCSGWPNS
jgi:hypothetical protein